MMGFFGRFFGNVTASNKPETRAFSSRNDELAALLSGGVAFQSGAIVSPRTAENLSTILACVGAISSALASLPTWVYRRTGAGREVDEGHPLMRLIRRGCNRHQTWPSWLEWTVASTLLYGNSLSEIVVDARGALLELRPIPWNWAAVSMLGSGRLVFDVSETPGVFGGSARGRRRLLQDQVLLLTDRSDDGVLGISRLRRAAAVIGGALSQQEFAHAVLSNGIYPSGVITAEGKLDQLQRQQLREGFKSFAGTDKAAKALILDQKLGWESMSISPEDQELLNSRRFTCEELCRIYGVPGPIVNDNTRSTFTNSETLIRFFAQSTLSAWCRRIEAAFASQVLSEAARSTHEVEIDLSGLLRGSPTERWETNKIAIETGVLTVNEIRELEGWGPIARPDDRPADQDMQQAAAA
jgi:HK97 family phage portal protein